MIEILYLLSLSLADIKGFFKNFNVDLIYNSSRRWKREQQKSEIMRGFPRAYMVGSLPFQNYISNKVGSAGNGYHQVRSFFMISPALTANY